jgi:hypothetical protein
MAASEAQRQPVEVEVLADVYDRAMARAKDQGQRLATVARQVLFQEAARTPADAPVPAGRPPLREYGQRRKPIKFSVLADAYATARDKIRASGRSVAAAVEDGLTVYARTGTLEPLPSDPPQQSAADREADLIRRRNP